MCTAVKSSALQRKIFYTKIVQSSLWPTKTKQNLTRAQISVTFLGSSKLFWAAGSSSISSSPTTAGASRRPHPLTSFLSVNCSVLKKNKTTKCRQKEEASWSCRISFPSQVEFSSSQSKDPASTHSSCDQPSVSKDYCILVFVVGCSANPCIWV